MQGEFDAHAFAPRARLQHADVGMPATAVEAEMNDQLQAGSHELRGERPLGALRCAANW
jgi:hypothetical protein